MTASSDTKEITLIDLDPYAASKRSLAPAVTVKGVTKSFKLPHQRVHTLKEFLLHPLRRYTFDQLMALSDVSFKVNEGEFFGIVGRNGSGKSTLLKCMAGIYRPNSGSLNLNGQASPFIELGVGFNPDLTARDNVLVNATLLGLSPREALESFDHIIEYAELEKFLDLKFKNYSSGMQVRLGFASAVQVDADILLVDEVLAVGDANFQQKCFESFREMKRVGKTVIFVTHDMQTVERFCDRALYLEGGRVVNIGHPSDIIREYSEENIQRQRHRKATKQTPQRPDVASSPEWGDGSAEIVEFWIEDGDGERQTVLHHGDDISFNLRIKFHRNLDNPDIRLFIHCDDEKRSTVFGTSTNTSHIVTPQGTAGDELSVSVALKNLLVEGTYYISLLITDQDGVVVVAKRLYVESFVVRGIAWNPGHVEIPHKISLTHISEQSKQIQQ